MAKQRRLQQWSRDNKLALASIVVGATIAIAAIIVPLVATSGGGSSGTIRNNYGQVNIGSTVVNGIPAESWGNPYGGGTTVPGQAYSCSSAASPQQNSATKQASVVAVTLFVRPYSNDDCFDTSSSPSVTPSQIEFEIRYINTSKVIQQDVEFRIELPRGLYLTPGTTYIMNSIYPKGRQINTDAIVENGIIAGSYTPGASAFIVFEADTPAIDDLDCGRNVLQTMAYVQPKGLDYFYNTADVILTRPCSNSASN